MDDDRFAQGAQEIEDTIRWLLQKDEEEDMRCVDCNKEAEYIHMGSSVCEEHFKKLVASIAESKARRKQS